MAAVQISANFRLQTEAPHRIGFFPLELQFSIELLFAHLFQVRARL